MTEMLRCPETHEEAFLVMSTGEMVGRMVRSGILGCPVCRKEYPIVKGIVNFSGGEGTPLRDKNTQSLRGVPSPPDAETLQALLDLSGPGGYVVLVGSAARHAVALAGLMGGVHFVGVDAPPDVAELPRLSLLACETMIPLRRALARAVVVGPERASRAWLGEALRGLLRGRRRVIGGADAAAAGGPEQRAGGEGAWGGGRGGAPPGKPGGGGR